MNKKDDAAKRRSQVKTLRWYVDKLTVDDIEHLAEIARRLYSRAQLTPKGDIMEN